MDKILLIIALLSFKTCAQFDSLIFQKYLYPHTFGVKALGDQNSDWYDDILIYDCNEKKASIFFGGSPIDTIPDWEITIIQRAIVTVDVNGDSFRDIVITYQDTLDSTQKGKVRIYYGGPLLDTIPDIQFQTPEGTGYNFGWNMYISKDFNGDGNSEILIYDADYPFNGGISYYGILYFYNTNPLDTIPYKEIKGDTLNNRRLYGVYITTGDLDGDGLTDIAITGDTWFWPTNEFINFYQGNSQWSTEPMQSYYRNEHTFDPTEMKIIEDINGDRKDDILLPSYGSFYPYYFRNVMLYGSIPIDTIPDAGVNTQNDAILNLVTPGDVNGDGYNDLLGGVLYGGPEQGRLWLGGSPMPEEPKQYYGGTFEGYGRLLAIVGDVNGDGLNDICVGQSHTDCSFGFVRIFAGDTLFKQPSDIGDINYKPTEFRLYDAYPNPFNPSAIISWELTVPGRIKITVYDAVGAKVATLLDSEQTTGKHQIVFNAEKYNLSSGVYFYKLKAEGSEVAKKIIYLK